MKKRFLPLLLLIPFPALANVIGGSYQNFNPTTNNIDYITVHSSETLAPGHLNVGAYFNYAKDTLSSYRPDASSTSSNSHDELTGMDLNVGLGLTRRLEIGLSLPSILKQSVGNNQFQTRFESTGMTEVKAFTKWNFFHTKNFGGAFVASTNIPLVDNDPFLGRDHGNIYNFELALDTHFNNFNVAMNLGYRYRDQGERLDPLIPIEPFDDQFLASLGTSYYFNEMDFKLIGEIYGAFPLKDQLFMTDKELTVLEFLLGAKKQYTDEFSVTLGGTTQLIDGTGTSDYRIFLGLNVNVGPLFGTRKKVMQLPIMKNEERLQSITLGSTLFGTNSAEINDDQKIQVLNDLDVLMMNRKIESITITGHTDSIGSREFNQDLSEKRAHSIRMMLFEHFKNIPQEKIVALGRGEDEPIADNGNQQGRAQNRRVDLAVKLK